VSKILTVGIATLDIINIVERYPREDEKMRAIDQRVSRGGNAANTACVLSQYGHDIDFAGVIVDEPDGHRIEQDMLENQIGLSFCQRVDGGKMPTSYITLNTDNASRTIVNYRDLPEYSVESFKQIPLQEFDWIHFEGRNIEHTIEMIRYARKHINNKIISVEIEKDRPGIDALMPLADVLMIPGAQVRRRGFTDPYLYFDHIRPQAPTATLITTWGAEGAFGRDSNNMDYHCPSIPPDKVIDTIGAGDTFNAAFINAFSSGLTLEESLSHACEIAGKKVAQLGFDNLVRPGH